MILLKNNEIDREKWNSLLAENSYSTPFQSPAFFDFFNSVPSLSSEVFAIEENGKLEALCLVTIQKETGLKGFFSRRAIIYGGPIIRDDYYKALAFLLQGIESNLRGKVIYIETRNLNDYTKYLSEFKQVGWDYLPYLNFHLNCSTEEIAWNNLDSNRKRQIKKAIKNEVEIIEATQLKEVLSFYEILKDLYKLKIHKPLPPKEFFENYFTQNVGKYLLIKYQNKIVGGIMSPILPGHTIYEWYIAGLDTEYKDISPSVMATYAAIQYGFNNGLHKFDFLGAGKPNEAYGVREFKEKFGGTLVENGRFIKILNPVLFNIGKIGLKILSKIK